MRIQPARYATEILNAITNNDLVALESWLIQAAAYGQPSAELTSLQAESLEILHACVESLLSSGATCGARRDVARQLLQHLAEREESGNDYAVADPREPSIRSDRCFPSLTISPR